MRTKQNILLVLFFITIQALNATIFYPYKGPALIISAFSEEKNLTLDTPKQIIMKWVEAYNSHIPDSVLSFYDENVTNIQLPWGKTVQGKESMRSVYLNTFRAFPDIHIEVENIVEEDSWVVIEWQFSGTMLGEFAGHAPTQNTFNMHGCEIFQLENGKILVQHGYWDKATMFRQLQLPLL